MKRCKDCIHDKVCDMWAVTSGLPFVNAETCECFENKAAYEKVVRCNECKKGKPMIFAGFYFCKRHRKCRTKYCFCSDGERSDT